MTGEAQRGEVKREGVRGLRKKGRRKPSEGNHVLNLDKCLDGDEFREPYYGASCLHEAILAILASAAPVFVCLNSQPLQGDDEVIVVVLGVQIGELGAEACGARIKRCGLFGAETQRHGLAPIFEETADGWEGGAT